MDKDGVAVLDDGDITEAVSQQKEDIQSPMKQGMLRIL
jgi:hypothetical protein